MTNTMNDRHTILIDTMTTALANDRASMRISLIAYAEYLAEVRPEEVRPYAEALRTIGREDWAQEIEDNML